MNCTYCQVQIALSNPLLERERIELWECKSCHCHYTTTKDGLPISTSWKVNVDDKQYFIKSYSGATGNAPEFIIAFFATNSEGKHYWEEVKRFDFIPKDWTPQNSAHKLRTYLPFL